MDLSFNDNILMPLGVSPEFKKKLESIGIDVEADENPSQRIVHSGKPSDRPDVFVDASDIIVRASTIKTSFNVWNSMCNELTAVGIEQSAFIVEESNQPLRLKAAVRRIDGSIFNATFDTYENAIMCKAYDNIAFKPGWRIIAARLGSERDLPEVDVYGRKIMNTDELIEWLGDDVCAKQLVLAYLLSEGKIQQKLFDELSRSISSIPEELEFVFQINELSPRSVRLRRKILNFVLGALPEQVNEYVIQQLLSVIVKYCFNSRDASAKFKQTIDGHV